MNDVACFHPVIKYSVLHVSTFADVSSTFCVKVILKILYQLHFVIKQLAVEAMHFVFQLA